MEETQFYIEIAFILILLDIADKFKLFVKIVVLLGIKRYPNILLQLTQIPLQKHVFGEYDYHIFSAFYFKGSSEPIKKTMNRRNNVTP